MSIARRWPQHRPGRGALLTFGAALVAIAAYFAVLHLLDGRAESYFRALRTSDPDLYLSQLREGRGFEAYVGEYRQMKGYDVSRAAAPDFLVGRWTMRAEPLRLTPDAAPAQCLDPVTFEYGLFLLPSEGGGTFPASYAIEDQTVLVASPTLGTFPVALVSYGARLDHIEFRPPGRDETVFAYNCGR